MEIRDFVRVCRDIQRWLDLIPGASEVTGLRAVPLEMGRHGCVSSTRLPFRLDEVLDVPSDGAEGAVSRAGVLEVVSAWADTVAGYRGEVRGVVHPCEYLAVCAPWIRRHLGGEYGVLCEDMAVLHERLAGRLGFMPERVGTCPVCGELLLRAWTESGIADSANCEGCGGMWSVSDGELDRARILATVRNPESWAGSDYVIRAAELLGYRSVTRDALWRWKYRGTVATRDSEQGMEYRLVDIFGRFDTPRGERA